MVLNQQDYNKRVLPILDNNVIPQIMENPRETFIKYVNKQITAKNAELEDCLKSQENSWWLPNVIHVL